MVQLAPSTAAREGLPFQCAPGVAARVLAYMLDSLVRVSRRVGGAHFVSIGREALTLSPGRGTGPRFKTQGPAGAGLRYLPGSEFPRRRTDAD
jgi:hypothetical protein